MNPNNPDVENCKRKVLVIANENFYLLVGRRFVQPTVPRENDPAMSKTRVMVETICEAITELLEQIPDDEPG